MENATFTPGTCGYLCPTKSFIKVKPRFVEYKVIWPNRAGASGSGFSEVADVVSLDSQVKDKKIMLERSNLLHDCH